MDNMKNIKFHSKSENGFTLTDLAIAIFVIMIFTGLIGTIFYRITEVKLSTQLSAEATVYAIQILEDIDRRDYEQVQNGMENNYKSIFQIPEGYELSLNVSDTNSTSSNGQPVKRVELRIKYTFKGRDEELVITRLKVREA